jgi:hypothetical protein
MKPRKRLEVRISMFSFGFPLSKKRWVSQSGYSRRVVISDLIEDLGTVPEFSIGTVLEFLC